MKTNIKIIIGVVVAVLISVGSCYVLADSIIDSKDVYYKDSSNLGFNNVQDAIDGTCVKFDNNLTNLKKELLNEMYPVGSIYISTSLSTVEKVKEALGGEWEAYGKGQTLVGVDTSQDEFNEVEKEGGSKSFNNSHTHTINPHTHTTGDHILTINEIPSHNHTLNMWLFSDASSTTSGAMYGLGYNFFGKTRSISSTNGSEQVLWGIGNTGGGQAHNHGDTGATALTTNAAGNSNQSLLQPYITVYMWRKIA